LGEGNKQAFDIANYQMSARPSARLLVSGEAVRRKLSMLSTQTINTENHSLLAGLSWEESPQKSSVEMGRSLGSNDSRPGVSDLSRVHPEAVIASSQDLGWQNIRVLQVRYAYGDMEVPPLDNHCVIVHLDQSLRVSASINGNDFNTSINWGEITIIPAGTASQWRWRNRDSHDALHIYLHPLFVQKTAQACGLNQGQIAIDPQLGVRDEQLSYIAMSLLYELKEENVVGRVYADYVAALFAMQLVRRYSYLKDAHHRKGGMSPRKLQKAIKLITDNLEQEQPIPLAAVAEEVGMSRYHFSRAFKQSMGSSPINYIVQQRIERAKKLLVETDLPIADIALRAGFSGQSHFTTFFRRLVGVTPRSFRMRM
jgi:AraC family transcriptional regulator